MKINYRNVKLQQNTDIDISIINTDTWKKIRKSKVKEAFKISCSAPGKKLYIKGEFKGDITSHEINLKAKVFTLNNKTNV